MTGNQGMRALRGAALLLAACGSAALSAQPTVSRPVVQPTGPSGTTQLNAALSRLATNPQDFDALLDAANAALQLGDIEAAIGFLTRADAVSPGNARVKAMIGSALVRNENPYDAIPYFDQAEAAGGDIASFASDRGLAFDLVGDTISAQTYYKLAMDKAPDDEVARRYALSLAVSGDRRLADSVLSPQIQKQDPAGWRTRTFILAISGNDDEAVSVADQMMPKDLADGIGPYLRYMPRLTKAQQVAAATFGRFPRAADIGRDDPRAAQYAMAPPRYLPGADAGLIPKGEPLGKNGKPAKGKSAGPDRRRPGAVDEPVQVAAAAPPPTLRPAPAPAPAPSPPPAQTKPLKPGRTPEPTPPPVSVAAATPVPAPKPVAAAPTPAPGPGFTSIAPANSPTPAPTSAPASAPASPPASFDLAQIGKSPAPATAPAAAPAPAPATTVAAAAPPPPQPQRVDFSSAFSDFRPPAEEQSASGPAVDLSRITPAKPKPPEPRQPPADARGARPDGPTAVSRTADTPEKGKGKTKTKTPPPPSHPSRIWVQVATGANDDALPTEWRRLVRTAPDVLRGKRGYTTPWRSNFRLLTGPFDSEAAAQAFLNQLRRAGIEGFQWTSPAGQAVDALPASR